MLRESYDETAHVKFSLMASRTHRRPTLSRPQTYTKYSLDFSSPITTAEAFEAVDCLADLPQQTWPQARLSSNVILTSFC